MSNKIEERDSSLNPWKQKKNPREYQRWWYKHVAVPREMQRRAEMEIPSKLLRTKAEIQRIEASGIDLDELNTRNLVFMYMNSLLHLSKGGKLGRRIPAGTRTKMRRAGVLETGCGSGKIRIRITEKGREMLNEELAK